MRIAAALLGGALVAALFGTALGVPTTADFSPTRLDSPVATAPRRIASLVSEADEMALGLAGPERMACRTYLAVDPESSNLVEEARRVETEIVHIADIERIVLLSPDLVIVNDFNKPEVVYLMQQAGLNVHRVRYPRRLQDVRDNLLHLGRALGEERRAVEWIREIDQTVEELRRRTQGRERPKVLVVSSFFWAEGRETLVDDLIRAAGGENVVESPSRFISPEEIVFLSPRLIVLSEGARAVFENDPALRTLADRCVTVAWREAQPPSQFAARALRGWGRRLHPDLFGDWK